MDGRMQFDPALGDEAAGYLNPSITNEARQLGRLFARCFAGFKGPRLQHAATEVLQMLLDEGVDFRLLSAEIESRARRRSQTVWEFEAWLRERLKEIDATVAPDGELLPEQEHVWYHFRKEFRRRFLAGKDDAFLDGWKQEFHKKLGARTTTGEVMSALDRYGTDPRRADQFWPGRNPANAFPVLVTFILQSRKAAPQQRQDAPAPAQDYPEGYSLNECRRRVQEAQRHDPGVKAWDVIEAYKRELRGS